MRKALNIIAIIALSALIGFGITACGEPGGGGGTTTCTQHGWNWTSNAIAATCTEPSKDTAICKNSGCTATDERTGSNSALGHQGVNAIPANCTEDGDTGTGTCTREGCEQPEVTGTVIPPDANAHIWGEYIQTTPPTCTAKGIKTQTCTLCPAVNPVTEDGDEINANNHDWDWNTYASGSGLRECQRSDCTVTAGIGHTGPAGGVIFYSTEFNFFTGTTVGDTTTVKRYYLEAAPANIATTLIWANNRTDLIPGLSNWDVLENREIDWAIGRGRLNTAIIIARGISQSYTTPAASACADLRTGDKDDWFLPSRNELNALAQIGGQHGIPNTDLFWSSSQSSSINAWSQGFDTGNQAVGAKDHFNFHVRAVRAF